MNRPQRVTDDLDRLLEVLPQVVQTCLATEAARDQLIEVVAVVELLFKLVLHKLAVQVVQVW